MRLNIPFLLLSIFMLVLSYSCNDDETNPTNPSTNQSSAAVLNDSLSVSIGSAFYDMSEFNVIFKAGGIILKSTNSNGEIIWIHINGQSVGSYPLTSDLENTIIFTNQDSTIDYWSTAGSGSIVLTKVDTSNKTISGSFHSTLLKDNLRNLNTSMSNGYFQDLTYTTSRLDLGTMSAKIDGQTLNIPFASGSGTFLWYNGRPIKTLVFGNHDWNSIPKNIKIWTDSVALKVGSHNITYSYSGSTQSGGGGDSVRVEYVVAPNNGIPAKVYKSINGNLTILSVDHNAKNVTGTFNFLAVNAQDTINVTQGQFNLPFE